MDGNQAPVLPSQGLGCQNWCINPARLADGLCWLCPEAEFSRRVEKFLFFRFNSEVSKTFIKKSPGQIFFTWGWFTQKFKTTPWTSAPWVDSFQRRTPRISVQHWQPQVGVPHQKKTLINDLQHMMHFSYRPPKMGLSYNQNTIPSVPGQCQNWWPGKLLNWLPNEVELAILPNIHWPKLCEENGWIITKPWKWIPLACHDASIISKVPKICQPHGKVLQERPIILFGVECLPKKQFIL